MVTRVSRGKLFPVAAPVPLALLPARVWSKEQRERTRRGYRAGDMDEKWDVFIEDRVAFLYRSWTGNGIFEAAFSPAGGGWRISAAVAGAERMRKVSAEFSRLFGVMR